MSSYEYGDLPETKTPFSKILVNSLRAALKMLYPINDSSQHRPDLTEQDFAAIRAKVDAEAEAQFLNPNPITQSHLASRLDSTEMFVQHVPQPPHNN